jgi:hypothetical protein
VAKSKEKNRNKNKKRKQDDAASQNTNNGVVAAVDTAPEGQQTQADEGNKKKKKYEKRIKVKLAGAVSNFLVLNAVSFRARYEGSGVYTFRVDKEQSAMLDDLCERLKE